MDQYHVSDCGLDSLKTAPSDGLLYRICLKDISVSASTTFLFCLTGFFSRILV